MRGLGAAIVVATSATAGCGGDTDTDATATTSSTATTATASSEASTADEEFPDIVAVDADFDDGSGTWSFAVTVSSPYDTPDRYADGWRVLGPDGAVYGIHTLAHDHADEQPFTRRQSGVEVPDGIETVTIEGRDQVSGFGGRTITVELIVGDR